MVIAQVMLRSMVVETQILHLRSTRANNTSHCVIPTRDGRDAMITFRKTQDSSCITVSAQAGKGSQQKSPSAALLSLGTIVDLLRMICQNICSSPPRTMSNEINTTNTTQPIILDMYVLQCLFSLLKTIVKMSIPATSFGIPLLKRKAI